MTNPKPAELPVRLFKDDAAWEAWLDRLERFLAQPQSPQPTVSKGEDNEP